MYRQKMMGKGMKEAVAVVSEHDPFPSALPPPPAANLSASCAHCCTRLQAVDAADCSVLHIVHAHCREEFMDWVLDS